MTLASSALLWRPAALAALLSLGPATAAAAQATLSFEQRVACREKVEDVYWAHRLWPRENRAPKPPREAVVPRSAIARRVEESLRYEAALSGVWGRPLTPEVVQAEIDREARSTRDPAMLRALWAALGNDPNLVAECLVRPELAERRIQELYAEDRALHATTRRRAESELAAATAGGGLEALRAGTGRVTTMVWVEKGRGEERRLPAGTIALRGDEWAQLEGALDEAFPAPSAAGSPAPPASTGPSRPTRLSLPTLPIPPTPRHPERRTLAGLPLGTLSLLREDADCFRAIQLQERSAGRVQAAAVSWPKRGFAEWWTGVREGFAAHAPAAGAYRLAAVAAGAPACDTWTISPNLAMPAGRIMHSAVWTGAEMIVWGGLDLFGDVSSGGRYAPGTDSWAAMTTVGVPTPRYSHTAVWTGSQMIVWGGGSSGADLEPLNTGGRYDPATDSWAATNTTGAPDPRIDHAAVWTGTEMIVWGGADTTVLNSGGRYQPSTDSWVATSTAGAPAGRSLSPAVWTGSAMIVWGGSDFERSSLNDGGIYTPGTDSWTATNPKGAPEARYSHTAVWTGAAMIVWGGVDSLSPGSVLDSGGIYTPGADSWAPTSPTGAPAGRQLHTAVWTGSEMIVWGGQDQGANFFDSGGRYLPETDSWVATATTAAPAPRASHTAIWTGSEMIVWGGAEALGGNADYFNSGGRYAPATDSWVATSTTSAPSPRFGQVAVWTGTEMIVWGGENDNIIGGNFPNSGGRYVPATDTWAATSTTGSPQPGTAVWTGTEMIVWSYGGARYNPGTDEWSPTSAVGAPEGRTAHTAVWTGNEMIIWGGDGAAGMLNSGGRYDPETDSWVATSSTGAPDARDEASAVWTGSEMIVWGGGFDLNTGGRYNPATDTWLATDSAGAPEGRIFHTAVWTGSQMIVWGGYHESTVTALNSGALYTPATDSWAPTGASGAPTQRFDHTAVWTGGEMIVWGGSGGQTAVDAGNGGRYTPASDSWAPTNPIGAPQSRARHTAVWTAREMIVWGGLSRPQQSTQELLGNGGLYCAAADAAPVAYAQSLIVAENGALPITLAATDADGDAMTYAIVIVPAHGTLTGTPPAVTYLPAGGYFGLDSFTFRAFDGVLDSNVATVSLRVDAPPVANAQAVAIAANFSLPITLTATDPDGDALTYAIVASPAHGALSGTPPAVTYAPAAGYVGPDSFTFKANDGLSDSNVAAVAIVVKPDGYLFYTVPPCRLFDSRTSMAPLRSGIEQVIPAGGHCGVPATARALAVNVTVVLPTANGYLNLYATPGSPPPTSVHDFTAGQVRANNAVVRVSPSGSVVALFMMSGGGNADLVVDVSGYFE